jgi:hypothetical protein
LIVLFPPESNDWLNFFLARVAVPDIPC